MCIKKSWMTGLVIGCGMAVLLAAALLFSFTEWDIPRLVYILVWICCIMAMQGIVGKIENS